MTLNKEEWGELQTTLATRSPVLVVGPGCHRVGYDTDPAWSEVIRRLGLVHLEIGTNRLLQAAPEQPRTFLDHLWLTKLSQETVSHFRMREPGDLPRGQDIHTTDTPAKWTDMDRARTVLATSLFGVLFETTRCLGNVIATGASPVTHWQSVSHPGPFGSGFVDEESDAFAGDDAGRFSDDAEHAFAARENATSHMLGVVEITSYLDRLQNDTPHENDAHVREVHRLEIAHPAKLKTTFALLKLEAIKATTEHLLRNYFQRTSGSPLTGALVEWLADLFWHVIATDSRVPPSQGEIAFYLNLRQCTDDATYGESEFRRARQGEALGPLTMDGITGDVRELLHTYDSGRDAWRDISTARVGLARTLCASLIELWRQRDHLPVVALVPDYDLSFERTLLEFLDEGNALHVVVPVWHRDRRTGQSYYLDWLFGTLERTSGRITSARLTRLDNWRWYGDIPGSGDEDDPVRGPIIVKLNGSPLLDLEGRPAGLELGRHEDVKLATVFTEHESLQAILSFADAGPKEGSSLASDIVDALDWRLCSWVFLGDSFPDWLPRVRLLFNAQTAWKSTPAEGHIAIDRRFDWPEVGLLRALGVQALREDLANVANYHTEVTNARHNPKVKAFLGNVFNTLNDHAQSND